MKVLSELEIVFASIPADSLKCGVYFLISDEKVMYVGQSVNIDARLAHHRLAGKVFDRWHWIPCRRDGLDSLERLYLNALLPSDNWDAETLRGRGGPRRRYMEETAPSAPPQLVHPREGMPLSSAEELAEARDAAEEEYQIRRQQMLTVRKMRQSEINPSRQTESDS